MKSIKLVFLVIGLIALNSCKFKKNDNHQLPRPIRFDKEWKRIQAAETGDKETEAISAFVERIYDERRFDTTEIRYRLYCTYEDINNQPRTIPTLFEEKASDSLKTIIVEVTPSVEYQDLTKQIYKSWKPKNLQNIRYFLDK